MAWFASSDDYKRESNTSDKYMKKTKLPTQAKSKKMYCRNCLQQIKAFGKPCQHCGVVSKPLRSRK